MFNIKLWRPVGSNTCEGITEPWSREPSKVAGYLAYANPELSNPQNLKDFSV